MNIRIMREAGYVEAMIGLSLSYGISPIDRAEKVALTLAQKDGGHNKFLESIYIWFDITAPRFWWQEADTYRLSTKQSESTMHTLGKRTLTHDDFEYPIYNLAEINNLLSANLNIAIIKNILPEGFLQRRIWVMNYKTLRNIILQRATHKLPQWKQFCAYALENVRHPQLLPTALNPRRQDTLEGSQVS